MIKKLISFTIHAHVLLTIAAFVFSYGILKLGPNQLEFSLALSFAVFGIYNFHRLIYNFTFHFGNPLSRFNKMVNAFYSDSACFKLDNGVLYFEI
jgi:hypothetical protein